MGPLRVLLISGSNRRQYNCPGVDSKSRMLMFRMAEKLPKDWKIDVEDLGNVYGRARIQSCNACVSTSMALCCWPCNCYEPHDKDEPDLMWDLDLYAGAPPAGSSPAAQQALGLNRDATFAPETSEGKKQRK